MAGYSLTGSVHLLIAFLVEKPGRDSGRQSSFFREKESFPLERRLQSGVYFLAGGTRRAWRGESASRRNKSQEAQRAANMLSRVVAGTKLRAIRSTSPRSFKECPMTMLLLLAGISILPGEPVLAENPDTITAPEVLKKSEAAYAAVKTYIGTTTVRSKADFGATAIEQTSTAKVTFMRPGKVHVAGRTASRDPSGKDGHPFAIVSDGAKTWKSFAIQNKGAFSEVRNISMAGMGGVAHGAAEGIPAALMKSDGTWVGGSDLFIVPRLSPTTLNGREKIDGADCYKLVAKNPQLGDVTMWIDAKSFLLRQTRRDMSESQHAAQKKSVEEALQKAGQQPPAVPANPIKSSSAVMTFTIDQVDGPVNEKLFVDPTKK